VGRFLVPEHLGVSPGWAYPKRCAWVLVATGGKWALPSLKLVMEYVWGYQWVSGEPTTA
jgi:hypothetical protein